MYTRPMNYTLNRLNSLRLLPAYFVQILSNIILPFILKVSHMFSSVLILPPKPYVCFLCYVTQT